MDAKILRLDENFAVMRLPDKTITLFPRGLLDSSIMEGDILDIQLKKTLVQGEGEPNLENL